MIHISQFGGFHIFQRGNMLVATLKEDETVLVEDNVRILVVEIQGKQVRPGIEAPPEVLILQEKIMKS